MSNKKIDDINSDDIPELDSNQLADRLLNNEMFLDQLISIVTTILYDKESGVGNKKCMSIRRKLIAKFKKLQNLLYQTRSLDFLQNIEKYLAQVRGLKAEFIQLCSQITQDDTTALHCSCAIKILEALTSHAAARKERKMLSSVAAECQDLYNFKHVTVPPDFTTQIAYPLTPLLHGTKDGVSEQSHEDIDGNDPAAAGNDDGPPTASGHSVVSVANNSNTAHATAQIPSSNSVSIAECNIDTVQDGSNDNSNPTIANLPFNNSTPVMGSSSNTNSSQVVSSHPVATTSTSLNAIAQESGDQSNGLYQCNSPTLLTTSGDGSTVSSRIQHFPHEEAREQIQQEVEPQCQKYSEGEEVPSVQEVNDHPDHGLASAHNSGSISDTETLSPTVVPTLVSEVKAAVQQIAVQPFYSTLEAHTPSNQNSESVQTGVLHASPGQVTCEATPNSQFITTASTAATKLNSTAYPEATVEYNEQCILGTRP